MRPMTESSGRDRPQTPPDMFEVRLGRMRDFMKETGRRPAPGGSPEEAALASWFWGTYSAALRGQLTADRAEAMAETAELCFSLPSAAAARVKDFYDTHGRLPSARADRGDYAALTKVRSLALNGLISGSDAKLLSSMGPTSFRPVPPAQIRDLSLQDGLAALEEWCAANGRRPRAFINAAAERTAAGRTEMALGLWVLRCRRANSRTAAEAARSESVAAILERYPSLHQARRQRQAVSVTAVKLVNFYQANGRLPHRTKEPSLYCSLRTLRTRAGKGELNTASLDLLNTVPAVLARVRLDTLPRLEELTRWCEANGHLPRIDVKRSTRSVTAEEDIERKLGQWMYRHVHRRHKDAKETEETRFVRSSILALQEKYPKHGYHRTPTAAPAA